jgi:hypothetical protein
VGEVSAERPDAAVEGSTSGEGVASPWLARACAGGLAVFVTLVGAAMAKYPGGTWFDRRAPGHSFWKNFLCDLFQRRALNGQDNTASAALATAGTVAMFVALGAFFALVSTLETAPSVSGKVARRAGGLACVAGLAVPLTPSDEGRATHLIAVLIACVPALAAVLAAARVCVRSRVSRGAVVWSIATVAFGTIDAVAYGVAFSLPYGVAWLNAMLPVFQRLAALSLVGWMLAVLASVSGRSGTPARRA